MRVSKKIKGKVKFKKTRGRVKEIFMVEADKNTPETKLDTLKILIGFKHDDSQTALLNKLRDAFYKDYLSINPDNPTSVREYYDFFSKGLDDFPPNLFLTDKAISAYKSFVSKKKKELKSVGPTVLNK